MGDGQICNRVIGHREPYGTRRLLTAAVCMIILGLLLSQYSIYNVISPSMAPEYPVYSVVIIKKEPLENLRVGDVIVFNGDAVGGRPVLHRVCRITEGGVYTKGDASEIEDNQLITKASYVGKKIINITFFAHYIAQLRSPAGFLLFLVLPSIAIAMLCTSVKLIKKRT